jgi:alpha,alpha-trehalase
LAQKWIRTNFKAFYESEPNHMYEKYDVTVDGHPGGGGEYDVVIGFGWTNGVVLDFLNTYGNRLVAPQNQTNPGTSGSSIPVFTSFSAVLISLSLLLTTIWG